MVPAESMVAATGGAYGDTAASAAVLRGSDRRMGARGDRERDIAAAERELAAAERALATSGSEDAWSLHERAAVAHEQSARLHESLADLYDYQDQRRDEEAG